MQQAAISSLLETFNANPQIEIIYNLYKAERLTELTESYFKELISSSDNLFFLTGVTPGTSRAKDSDMLDQNIMSFDLDFKEFDPTFYELESVTKLQKVTTVWERKKAALDALDLTPWLVVFSGNGLHLHYRVEEFISVKNYSTYYDFVFKSLVTVFPELDPTCRNIARIMRLPLSLNSKPGSRPTRSSFIAHNEVWLDNFLKSFTPSVIIEKSIETTKSVVWGAGENAEEDLAKDRTHLDNVKDHLTLDLIFNHFKQNIVNRTVDSSGQTWVSSPWRRNNRPAEQGSPSFAFRQDKTWYCHSSGKGGDVFALIGALSNLDYRDKEQFKKILNIAEDISGKKRSNVVRLESRRPPDKDRIREALSEIPADTPLVELVEKLQPVVQMLANGNDVLDEVYLEVMKETFRLKYYTIQSLRKQIKQSRKNSATIEAPQSEAKSDDEIDLQLYYALFENLGILHEKLSSAAVTYQPAKQEEQPGGNMPYALTPATINYCNTREFRAYLESIALTTPGVDYNHVHRVLARYMREVKAPQILIKESVELRDFEGLLNSPLGTVVSSFNVTDDNDTDPGFRFTSLEICKIYRYCLALSHLRLKNNGIRPVVPVLVSSKEDIGKDTAISTMIFHWHPYVKKISFGKGSQEKEIQKAFSTSLIQHIEEFEKVADMNPAFIRSLFSGDYSDTTLKGDNETTRLYYRGIALGSANSCGFLTPGADNSRFIPIVIDSINKLGYKPSLDLSAQIFAMTRAAAYSNAYQLDDELQEKIRRVQAYYNKDSEGAAFSELFDFFFSTEFLPSISYAERNRILEDGVISNEDCIRLGILTKFQDKYSAYKNITEFQFRKLLRLGQWYDSTKNYKLKSSGKTVRGVKLPEQYKAEPVGFELFEENNE